MLEIYVNIAAIVYLLGLLSIVLANKFTKTGALKPAILVIFMSITWVFWGAVFVTAFIFWIFRKR